MEEDMRFGLLLGQLLESYGPHASNFIKDIGHRIKESMSEKQATSYLMQAIDITIQRGKLAALKILTWAVKYPIFEGNFLCTH